MCVCVCVCLCVCVCVCVCVFSKKQEGSFNTVLSVWLNSVFQDHLELQGQSSLNSVRGSHRGNPAFQGLGVFLVTWRGGSCWAAATMPAAAPIGLSSSSPALEFPPRPRPAPHKLGLWVLSSVTHCLRSPSLKDGILRRLDCLRP